MQAARDAEDALRQLEELPPYSPDLEHIVRLAHELRTVRRPLANSSQLTDGLLDSARRSSAAARSLVERWRWPDGDLYDDAPGAGLPGERHTHVVCDALAEVRVRELDDPSRPRHSVAADVFDEAVDSAGTLRDYLALQAGGDEYVERHGVPAELARRYQREPARTRALLGFGALVNESYGPPDA